MTMQRRHFELIAAVLKDAFQCFPREDEVSRNAIEKTARLMVRELRATNPNFNEARFLRACGVTDA